MLWGGVAACHKYGIRTVHCVNTANRFHKFSEENRTGKHKTRWKCTTHLKEKKLF